MNTVAYSDGLETFSHLGNVNSFDHGERWPDKCINNSLIAK